MSSSQSHKKSAPTGTDKKPIRLPPGSPVNHKTGQNEPPGRGRPPVIVIRKLIRVPQKIPMLRKYRFLKPSVHSRMSHRISWIRLGHPMTNSKSGKKIRKLFSANINTYSINTGVLRKKTS